MSSKYNNTPSGAPPAYPASPAPIHSAPQNEAAGYYGPSQYPQPQQYPHPQQYGSPGPYGQGPYPPPGQYQQGYPMQYGPQPGYGAPPPGGYYADGRGGAGSGICGALLGACACLACFDLCFLF